MNKNKIFENEDSDLDLVQIRKNLKIGKYIVVIANILAAIFFATIYFLFPVKEILFLILAGILFLVTVMFLFLFRYFEKKLLVINKNS